MSSSTFLVVYVMFLFIAKSARLYVLDLLAFGRVVDIFRNLLEFFYNFAKNNREMKLMWKERKKKMVDKKMQFNCKIHLQKPHDATILSSSYFWCLCTPKLASYHVDAFTILIQTGSNQDNRDWAIEIKWALRNFVIKLNFPIFDQTWRVRNLLLLEFWKAKVASATIKGKFGHHSPSS